MKLAAALLIAFTLLLTWSPRSSAQSVPAPLSGNWAGSLNASGTKVPLIFHFKLSADGTLTATFDSIEQGATGLSFNAAQVTGQTVHLAAASIGASFEGTLDAERKTITGYWRQGGASLPLTLTQTSKSATMLDRPQEPHPPFPYTARDVTFPGSAAGVTLAGTLTLPPGTGPFPAAVLIAGSGPNARDEVIFGHKPFLLLADTLTRRGIAVLRYDKRGIGSSTGSYVLATSADFAADAAAAVAYLKTQTAVDPKRIGLIGHSEGGLIAPLVASEHPADIAFAVLLAGPGLNGEKILLAQSALIAKAEGGSADAIAQNAALQHQMFAIAKSSSSQPAAQSQAQAAILRTLSTLSAADKAEIGDPEKFASRQAKAATSPWMRSFLIYDPLPALRKTRCPVLALAGSKDLQVPPTEDLVAIASALKSGGNTNVTIKELPDLNHLFQTCKTGSPSEYAKISETMAPIALVTVSDWVAAQTRTK